jgi:hypothetical protein
LRHLLTHTAERRPHPLFAGGSFDRDDGHKQKFFGRLARELASPQSIVNAKRILDLLRHEFYPGCLLASGRGVMDYFDENAEDLQNLMDEISKDYKSRDRWGRWSDAIGGGMVLWASVGVWLDDQMPMNHAFGLAAVGLLISIWGATQTLRASAQSVKLAILRYAALRVDPSECTED